MGMCCLVVLEAGKSGSEGLVSTEGLLAMVGRAGQKKGIKARGSQTLSHNKSTQDD